MNGSGMFIGIVPPRMYVSIGLSAAAFTRHEHLAAGGLGRRQVADDDAFGRDRVG